VCRYCIVLLLTVSTTRATPNLRNTKTMKTATKWTVLKTTKFQGAASVEMTIAGQFATKREATAFSKSLTGSFSVVTDDVQRTLNTIPAHPIALV